MKKFYKFVLVSAIAALSVSQPQAKEKLIVVDEGTWQTDNGRLSYFEDGKVVSNQWFRDVNGHKLGDTPEDIIQVKPNLIAIAVSSSNIIQFIDDTGHRIAETEDIPNNRKLATDGDYVYVTSYAHQCQTTQGVKNFTKGFVAKIDITTFKVVDAVEVGYEPEGIAYYEGKLFVANSGGYAFQENHDYEKTVSVIDPASMTVVRMVDTGHINLYGTLSRSGQYLCINSAGDYYEVDPVTVIFDCQAVLDGKSDAECFCTLDYVATNNCTDTEGNFYVVGSKYSYLTGGYEYDYLTIDPEAVMQSNGEAGVSTTLPGSLVEYIKKMTSPAGIYVNPYTGYIYATDAAGYVDGGYLYQWSPEGDFIGKYGVYINPSHFLALNPNGDVNGIDRVDTDACVEDAPMYNLQGLRINSAVKGQIYIQNGQKKIRL